MARDKLVFHFIGYLIISIVSLLCVLPLMLVLSASFTSTEAIYEFGYTLFPKEFSLDGYEAILNNPVTVFKAYGVTIYSTIVGTCLGLFLTAMGAYVIWRKDFAWRNAFAFFFYFTTLFQGGLVPWYILCVKYLHFKEIPLVTVVLPYLISVFNLLIIRNFMRSIPESIVESAKMDGAGDFQIFIRLILPLSKPALASIGLFISLSYWNDWLLSFLFVDGGSFIQLQYFLYKMISTMEVASQIASEAGISMGEMPTETMKMAMTIIVVGPIVFLYPFLQKYFVKGLTIGAVKG